MSQRHFDFFHSKDEGLSMHQAWQGAQDLGRLNAVSNAFGYRLRTHRNCIFDSRTEVVRVVQVGVGATWPKCIQNASKCCNAHAAHTAHSLQFDQGSLPLRDLPEPPWSDVSDVPLDSECNSTRHSIPVSLCISISLLQKGDFKQK